MKEELRSLRSLQDGNENGGELFAFLSQRCQRFRADDPGFHEQFQPVGAFFDLARRISAFRDELIRSLPTRSPLPRGFTVYVAPRQSLHSALLRARNASR
jgi:hypothetical protein